ncbi:MAG: DEAD/DEAH box helicase [Deltaproteobacteria bacterium]|nr:DEAD/DEAH box helicase [Deltaproteobacteria bacterium]
MENPQKKSTSRKEKAPAPAAALAGRDSNRLEFFRHAVGLLPKATDRTPGLAILVHDGHGEEASRSCSCRAARRRTCAHLLELAALAGHPEDNGSGTGLDAAFRGSVWYRLAKLLADDCDDTPEAVRFQLRRGAIDAGQVLGVMNSQGEELLVYASPGADQQRLLERCGQVPEPRGGGSRASLLRQLALLTLTESERRLLEHGFRSYALAFQESFWYRFAYHLHREFDTTALRWRPEIDTSDGRFRVACREPEDRLLFTLTVPRLKVKRFLQTFRDHLQNDAGLGIDPVPLDVLFDVRLTNSADLSIRPTLRMLRQDGEYRTLKKVDFQRFRYGDLVYIAELGILADMQEIDTERRDVSLFGETVIPQSRVPSFIAAHASDLAGDRFRIDATAGDLRILTTYDRMEIIPEAVERDWCWLSITYGFGAHRVSLKEILQARTEGRRFIPTPEGWVDCRSEDMAVLDGFSALAEGAAPETEPGRIKLSRMELLRLQALSPVPVVIGGDEGPREFARRLLNVQSPSPLPEISGMTSRLRVYQVRGVEWLWFLNRNGFGGLLCDDMGLGKTHQVMALMLALKDLGEDEGPFFVICPVTVISHWQDKIRMHAPSLSTEVYHGGARDLAGALKGSDVLLTSYGILRRDIDQLSRIPFALAVFDEVQHIKNNQTRAYRAAVDVRAVCKIGLTGTPIENRLSDLKAMMDLTVPGYLASDAAFEERYGAVIEAGPECSRNPELERLIAPFTLRRLKKSVLTELPPKIEDQRTCRLSDEQVKLYRDAIGSRRAAALDPLYDPKAVIPYIHIFALLNLLKQICNHPALLEEAVGDYDRCASGKWELFKELLAESLDSGQKVVVYSQFLKMIAIIADHLKRQNIDCAVLTGSSRHRGALIRRFNTDPQCRVFVGSLKAGGIGIDLTAASVVIHYDRWWNAAREDQATDRVHRIGQSRGVQVFKLVTEGTLEEKIAAVIARKKDLMERVLKEDDPGLLKTFTRQDLVDMLALPEVSQLPD